MRFLTRLHWIVLTLALAIMCVSAIVLLTTLLGPTPPDTPKVTQQQDDYQMQIAPEWLRWVSLSLLLGGFAALMGVNVVVNRRARQAADELTQDIMDHPPKPISGEGEPSREPLAKLLQELEGKGFRHLGQYESRYAKDRSTLAWVMVDLEGTIRAVGAMPDWTRQPDVMLSSLFPDGALLESHTPTTARAGIAHKDYMLTYHATLDRSLAFHTRQMQVLAAKHGPAIVVKTMAEYIELMPRASAHLPAYFRATRGGRFGVSIIAGLVMVLPVSVFLVFNADGAPLYCAIMGLIFGVMLAISTGGIWLRQRRIYP